MSAIGLSDERERLAQLAFDLARRRVTVVTPEMLAAEAGMSRHALEAIFPDEGAVFDAVAELWFRPLTAMMEDVLASDLPANRKMYEFFARRFVHLRGLHRDHPAFFRLICELGARHFERVRSYVDLADHYLCELIAQGQHEGHFEGLEIDRALSLVNQMVYCYTMPDVLPMIEHRLSEEKLAAIIDTLFAGLSATDGGARGVRGLRAA
jgi:TetR/AcrR family transcriptional regulator, repressor of the ameABC operon